MSISQARQLIELKRWPEAQAALTPALADPNADAQPWCLLALCHLGQNDPRAARRAAHRAIAAEPDDEWAHRLLAFTLLRGRRSRAARRAADRALAIAPEKAETLAMMVQVQLSRYRVRAAQRLATRNLVANPFSSLARQSAAGVALRRRRWAEAERQARAGLALTPHDPHLMMQLGTALQGQGQRPEAAEVYASAVRTDPTDGRGRLALGRLGGSGQLAGLRYIVVRLLIVNFVFRLVIDDRRHPGTVALILAGLAGLVYGYQEVRHRLALAGIRPNLRELAFRERRRATRGWLLWVAVVSLLLAWFAGLRQDRVTVALLALVVAAALALRQFWNTGPATIDSHQGWWRGSWPGSWWGWRHNIRWRLR